MTIPIIGLDIIGLDVAPDVVVIDDVELGPQDNYKVGAGEQCQHLFEATFEGRQEYEGEGKLMARPSFGA